MQSNEHKNEGMHRHKDPVPGTPDPLNPHMIHPPAEDVNPASTPEIADGVPTDYRTEEQKIKDLASDPKPPGDVAHDAAEAKAKAAEAKAKAEAEVQERKAKK